VIYFDFLKKFNAKTIKVVFFVFLFSVNSYATDLTNLLAELFETDHSIKSAESGVKEAENDVTSAWTAYLPEFDAKYIKGTERKYKYEAANDMYTHQEFDLTLKQKIYDFGETSSDIKQKRNALNVSKIDLNSDRMTLIIDAVDAYLGYIDAVKKLDSETEALESKIESTGQEESRVKKGSGMPSDVLQAKADLAGAQKSKIQAEGDLRKAYNKYVKIFKSEPPKDISVMNLIELSSMGKSQLPKNIDQAIQQAFQNNADLLKKKYDLEDAKQDLVSSRAAFMPDLDFESTYKHKYNVSGTLGGTQEVNWKVTLAVPLQPWQDMPDYKNKKLALLTAESDLQEEEYALSQTVSDLWEDYQVALLTRDFAANKVVISEELLSIKKRERQLEQADAAAVTAAENAVNDDNKALIDDETALTESSLDLLEAMGVLTLASIKDVSEEVQPENEVGDNSSVEETESDVQAVEETAEEEATPEAAPVDPVIITNYSSSEEQQLAADAEQARQVLAELLQKDNSDDSQENSSGECPSNVYVGQKQADGSWKTVCKE